MNVDTSPDALERVADGLDEAGTAFHQDAVSALRAIAAKMRAAVPVVYGLRRKGTTAIVGLLPIKLAERPSTWPGYQDQYEEVPLYESAALALQSKDAQRLREAIKRDAANAAYNAGLEVSDWRPFVPRHTSDAMDSSHET